jgi:hypothetical protein
MPFHKLGFITRQVALPFPGFELLQVVFFQQPSPEVSTATYRYIFK